MIKKSTWINWKEKEINNLANKTDSEKRGYSLIILYIGGRKEKQNHLL